MPQQAYRDRNYYSRMSVYDGRNIEHSHGDVHFKTAHSEYDRVRQIKPNQKKINRNLFIHKIISLVFFMLVAIFVIPAMFNKFIKAIPDGSRYSEIKMDYNLRQ